MRSSPEGPGDKARWVDAPLRKLCGYAANFLNGPADKRRAKGSAVSLPCWPGFGPMTDRGHHGESEHDERDVAMPSMPGAGLVMIEAQLVFRRLEAVFDGPAAAFHADQFVDGGSRRSPGGEEGQVVICDGAADQKAARPKTGAAGIVFAGVEIGQFHISPVVEARSLGAIARRQAFPVRRRQALRDAFRRACDGLGLAPGGDAVVLGDAKHIALAGPAQCRSTSPTP